MQHSNHHALLIGVGKRADDENPHMDITAKDAQRLGVELGNICQVPATNIAYLTNEEATLKNINAQLDALIESTKKSKAEMVWFYFSGHGYQTTSNRPPQYYLSCRDTTVDLDATALLGSDLLNKLKQIETDKMVILLDCCYAGGISNAQVIKTYLPLDAENMKMNNRVIITASHSSEESFVSSPVSVFTYALIQGLSGDYLKGADTNITIFDLAMFIREQVNGLSNFKQKPRLYAFENNGTQNFILAHHPNGRPKTPVFKEKFVLLDAKGNPINQDLNILKDTAYRAEYQWLEKLTVEHIETAHIERIEKVDVRLVNELKVTLTEGGVQKLHEQTGQLLSLAPRNEDVPFISYCPYVGRDKDVARLQSFFENPKKHFLFLFGKGGIGKSHLLQEVNELLTIKPAYFGLGQITNMVALASKMGYGDVANYSDAQQRDLFLKNAAAKTVPLVFDDFYELRDELMSKTILELSNLREGKFLLISRVLPIGYKGINIEQRQLELNELSQDDFSVHLKNYHEELKYDFDLTPQLINACWEHCQGYPLGGNFLLELRAVSGEDFDKDIKTIPKIDPKTNIPHYDFMKRLLGSILKKGTKQEQELARQMAVFTEPMPRAVFIGLPAFERDAFYALTERKKIFYRRKGDFFGVHALIRTILEIESGVSYEAHAYAGQYYENKVIETKVVNIENLIKAHFHFSQCKNSDKHHEFEGFIERWLPEYGELSVKTLVKNNDTYILDKFRFKLVLKQDDESRMDVARVMRHLGKPEEAIPLLELVVESNYLPAFTELGIAYRKIGNLSKAIEVLQKAADAGNSPSMNELGIAYRENKNLPKAIEFLEKAVAAGNLASVSELSIAYRENSDIENAFYSIKRGLNMSPDHKTRTYMNFNLFLLYLFFEPKHSEAISLFESVEPTIKSDNLKFQYKTIIENFESILSIKQNDIRIYSIYINYLFQYKSWDWAVIYLEKLIKVHPTSEFKGKYGKALIKAGRFLEALPILKAASKATNKPGQEVYFQHISADYQEAVESAAAYLDALKKKGANKEARKKFDVLQEYLTDLPDFDIRKAFWRGE